MLFLRKKSRERERERAMVQAVMGFINDAKFWFFERSDRFQITPAFGFYISPKFQISNIPCTTGLTASTATLSPTKPCSTFVNYGGQAGLPPLQTNPQTLAGSTLFRLTNSHNFLNHKSVFPRYFVFGTGFVQYSIWNLPSFQAMSLQPFHRSSQGKYYETNFCIGVNISGLSFQNHPGLSSIIGNPNIVTFTVALSFPAILYNYL